jgi:hypothetical protein
METKHQKYYYLKLIFSSVVQGQNLMPAKKVSSVAPKSTQVDENTTFGLNLQNSTTNTQNLKMEIDEAKQHLAKNALKAKKPPQTRSTQIPEELLPIFRGMSLLFCYKWSKSEIWLHETNWHILSKKFFEIVESTNRKFAKEFSDENSLAVALKAALEKNLKLKFTISQPKDLKIHVYKPPRSLDSLRSELSGKYQLYERKELEILEKYGDGVVNLVSYWFKRFNFQKG